MSLKRPELQWDDGTPIATAFDDVYFHKGDGLEETRYVFLDGNDLSNRFSKAEHFVVGETGFGTGLNFLAAWQLWRQTASPSAKLHFISLEAFPLHRDDLAQAHTAFPELAELSAELRAAYPAVTPTTHRLMLDKGRVILDLHFGEAGKVLSSLSAKIDAWFLDGFAPSKNPEMWRKNVLSALAARSKPGGTLATFTAAGDVRRGLETAGFEVSKRPGFGHKRHMVTAQKPDSSPYRDALPCWSPRSTTESREAVIIGGGIAGSSIARALKKRGLKPLLIEQHAQLATEASGNAAGLVKPLITPDNSPSARFYTACFTYLTQLLEQIGEQVGFRKSGLLDLPTSEQESRRFEKLIRCGHWPEELVRSVDQAEASALFGLPVSHGGLFFPGAGWLIPPKFCQAMAEGVEMRYATRAVIRRTEEGEWLINGELRTRLLILANGMNVHEVPETAWLKDILHPVRGQTSRLAETEISRQIRCPLHQAGYIIPSLQGAHVVGATFIAHDPSTDVTDSDHIENLTTIHSVLPNLFDGQRPIDGRAASRSCAPDHLPVVGPLFDIAEFFRRFGHNPDLMDLRRTEPIPPLSGLYCLTGLGARGMLGAPLAADLLASEIVDDPLPLPSEIALAVRPARFAYRALKRHNWREAWS